MRRREFLTVSRSALGGVLLYSLDRQPMRLHAQDAEKVKIPLRFFKEIEALTIAAAAARIFPTDASGPGATEAGVVIFIDRQLAGPYGRDKHRYTSPPFEEGVPEQGYQGAASPREVYRQGIATLGAGFHQLPPGEQDEKLRAIEKGHFFQLLRQNTIEGMFCDPMHGGNAGLIGWQLIGYPGPYMSWSGEIDRHFGKAFRPKPASLADVLGRPVKPGEETE